MNLVVDVGNTRIKYAFFDEKGRMESGYERAELFRRLSDLKRQGEHFDLFLSGCGLIDEEMKRELNGFAGFWLEADPLMAVPLEIDYATPHTLGFDRIAICVGARSLFPEKNLLVIDSGTAITYNYVNREGVFLGGNIAPGQEIRFRALHQFTAKLPYIEADMDYGAVGTTTDAAIRNGVMNGILFEVEGYVSRFMAEKENAQIVITGGNCVFLKNRLNSVICFNENIGFIGLNEVLEYHKKQS